MTKNHYFSTAAVLACSLTLSACGGGENGQGIASTPPPTIVSTEVSGMTPLNPTPAITTGDYDAIALDDKTSVASIGAVRIAVDATAMTYTLTVDTGAYRPPPVLFDYSEVPGNPAGTQLGMEVHYVDKYSDGSTKPAYTINVTSGSFDSESQPDDQTKVYAHLVIAQAGTSDPGSSYVSLGQWSISEAKLNAAGGYDPTGKHSSGYFVFGNRTAPADIPISGTATYSGTSLTNYFPVSLTADFGQQSMSAQISHTFGYAGDQSAGYEFYPGVDLHGSAPIGSLGDFSVPLSGSFTNGSDLDHTVTVSVTGSLDGAFFGPGVQQVGGVFSAGEIPSQPLVSDAFVGVKE